MPKQRVIITLIQSNKNNKNRYKNLNQILSSESSSNNSALPFVQNHLDFYQNLQPLLTWCSCWRSTWQSAQASSSVVLVIWVSSPLDSLGNLCPISIRVPKRMRFFMYLNIASNSIHVHLLFHKNKLRSLLFIVHKVWI